MNFKQLRILILLMLTVSINNAFAQFQIISLSKSSYSSTTGRAQAREDTLSLPFWDDFSQVSINPDSNYWSYGDGLHISNHIGLRQPTTNVATFDGHDAFGNPYGTSEFSQKTDTLISKPIDLASVNSANKDSVYFSFYWQMKGRGESPDPDDYIELQFLSADTTWHTVWIKEGIIDNLSEDFTIWQRSITFLNDSLSVDFFHEGFRFRFRAFGNTKGPFDVWHIDYVYLNEGRTDEEEDKQSDLALAGGPTSIFKDFWAIPMDQFRQYPDTIFQTVRYGISNFRKDPFLQQTNYWLGTDTISNTLAWDFGVFEGLPFVGFYREVDMDSTLSSANFSSAITLLDSAIIESVFYLDGTGDNDLGNGQSFQDNDTLISYFELHETLAYDDGTAEFAAEIRGNQGEIAIQYNVAGSDTLTHVDIYFPQIALGSIGKAFFVKIYEYVNDSTPGTLLRQQEFQIQPNTAINQFTRYDLTRPVILSGRFYLGFQQGADDSIPIGLDENNQTGDRVIVNVSGVEGAWERNFRVEGTTMIRPIFARNGYIVSNVTDIVENIRLFPNPSDDIVHVQGQFESYEIFDLTGHRILVGKSNRIDVRQFKDGFYVIRVLSNGRVHSEKFVVKH